MNRRGQYYELPARRLEEIAAAGPGLLMVGAVERICLGQDWSEGQSHQTWLETAPAGEIAAWVRAILDDEQSEAEHE